MNGNYYKSDYLDNNHLVNDNGIIEKVGNDYLIVSNPTMVNGILFYQYI